MCDWYATQETNLLGKNNLNLYIINNNSFKTCLVPLPFFITTVFEYAKQENSMWRKIGGLSVINFCL